MISLFKFLQLSLQSLLPHRPILTCDSLLKLPFLFCRQFLSFPSFSFIKIFAILRRNTSHAISDLLLVLLDHLLIEGELFCLSNSLPLEVRAYVINHVVSVPYASCIISCFLHTSGVLFATTLHAKTHTVFHAIPVVTHVSALSVLAVLGAFGKLCVFFGVLKIRLVSGMLGYGE